jgi:MFS family permease
MAGMIVGSYGLTQMVLRIPLGIASDLLKKRKLFVMIGFGLSIVASSGLSVVALCAVGESVPEWLAAAALLFRGISGMTAATWVNFTVLYSSSCQGDQVAAAMSRIVVPQCGSQIIAMLLGAQLADRLGELYAFLLAAAAGIAGLIVMSMVRERPPAGAPVTLKSFAAVAKNRQLIIGTLLATIISWSCGLRCGRRTGTDHALLPDLQL